MNLRRREHQRPWRELNRFKLLVDGPNYFPEMLQAINTARHYIALEIYLVQSANITSQFINALVAAASRGVRVYILLDHYGARGLNFDDREKLNCNNIELVFYNPLNILHIKKYLFRNHRKVLIIDGLQAFSGGTGLSDHFVSGHGGQEKWRETMIKIEGESVSDWENVVKKTWKLSSNRAIELTSVFPSPCTLSQQGRVVTSPNGTQRDIQITLINRIRNAKTRVWISTAYFIPSRKIRKALRRSAQRGIDVRLLLPGPIIDHPPVRHASRRFYRRLLRNGVQIYEYQPRFLHSKTMLCDDWVSIGSCNIDRWNLRWNLEANQEVLDANFAQEVKNMFEQDFSESHNIEVVHWQRRNMYGRLLEWFWGHIDRLLAKLDHK